MAYLIHTFGEPQEVTPANGKFFTLKEMQKLVGGLIEYCDTKLAGKVMVCNEDGKNLGMNINLLATAHYAYSAGATREGKPVLYDVIVGDVLFGSKEELCSDIEQ